jgi:predicted MFS family arabinose efflux permease
MRQNNFSLEVIGMLQFVKLPWILKFLWSPAVDRTCFRLKDYKTWIFSSEIIYAVIILAISFMSFNITPALIIGLIICAFIASATQDIATDALAVISFRREDKSLVNSMQSMGSFAGAMIGAGLLLLLYDTLGWNNLLPFLALFVIVAVIPLIFYSRKQIEAPLEEKTVSKAHPNDLLGFFKQKGIWKQIPFLFLYYMGLIGTLAMLKPMLVDFGYDLRDIGVISGVIGTSIGCAGSLAGGFIVKKIGRNASRILFAVCILISAIYFYSLLAFLPFNIATLHLGVSLLWLSYGMSTIIVYTTAMDCVRKGYEGTDFTIQTVITHLSGMIMAVVSGTIAKESGYRNLFLVEAAVAAVSLIYILFVFKARKGGKAG